MIMSSKMFYLFTKSRASFICIFVSSSLKSYSLFWSLRRNETALKLIFSLPVTIESVLRSIEAVGQMTGSELYFFNILIVSPALS